jgi:hypothetical protein
VVASIPEVGIHLVNVIRGECGTKIPIDSVQHKLAIFFVCPITLERLTFAGWAGKPFQYLALHVQFVLAVGVVEICLAVSVSNKLPVAVDEAAIEALHQIHCSIRIIHFAPLLTMFHLIFFS